MPAVLGSFDNLTEAFAAAAVDPARWDAAMDIASEATGSLGAMLFPVRGRTPSLPKSESTRALAEDYLGGGWVHRDERYRSVPALLRRGVSSEFDFTTPEEMAKSPYYQDFLGRHGLKWFAGVKVGEGEDVWALVLQRTSAQGPFSPDELDRLVGLSRRLAGAAALARAFESARIEGVLAAFDASRTPVAAIDRSGEVVRLNPSAEGLLGADLQVVRKRLVSFNRDATAALDRALHALIWTRGEAFHAPVVLPRRFGRPIIAYPSRLAAEAFYISGAPSGYGAQSGDGTPVPYSAALWEPTDAPIDVVLYVYAAVNNGLPFESPAPTPTFDSTSAYIDPYFSIDPSNADAGAYSILVSPGIGNAPSSGVLGTPEPSIWAMMLLGFAGLGWAGWRRGRAAARIVRARA